MPTLTEDLQQAIRTAFNCANDFNGDLHVLCDSYGVPQAPISGRLIDVVSRFTGSPLSASAALNSLLQSPSTYVPSFGLSFSSSEYIDSRVTFTRASTATRVNSSGLIESVAADVARLDYEPVTRLAKGLLIEEQRTNLLTYSEDFRNTAEAGSTRPWTQFVDADMTVVPTSEVAPTGQVVSLSKVICSNLNASQRQTAQVVAGAADNTIYCFSVFVKPEAVQGIGIVFTCKNATYPNVGWDLTTGTQNTISGAILSHGIERHENGWFRVWATANSLTGASSFTVNILMKNAAGGNYTPAAVGDGYFTWGAQCEQGTFPTSYIPTVASQVTRAAESASVNTLTPWFNSTSGTMYVEFDSFGYAPAIYPGIAQLGVTGIGSRGYIHVLNGPSATTSFNVFDDALAYQGPSSSIAYTTGARRKMIGAYAANDAAGTADGAAAVTDTTVILPTGINVLSLGNYPNFATANSVNGHIRSFTYFPRRMTNAELQSLTVL